MAQCKTAVTPLLMHWNYCTIALSHPYDHVDNVDSVRSLDAGY